MCCYFPDLSLMYALYYSLVVVAESYGRRYGGRHCMYLTFRLGGHEKNWYNLMPGYILDR